MSHIATPARKADALIGDLERLDRSYVLGDLAMSRLSRDARTLMNTDAIGAHTVLGGIAGIEGDAAKVREHYKVALELSGRTLQALGNYATALGKAGEVDEAFKTIMEAHQRAPDDLQILRHAILIAVQGGQLQGSRSFYEQWNNLQPARRMNEEAPMSNAAAAAERGVFSEEAVQRVIRIAHQVRLAAKVRYAGSSIHLVCGEPDRFSFKLYVHTSTRLAVDLNTQFAERIVNDERLMADPGLMFVPMFMGKKVHASDSRGVA